ncbi:kelch domain-containing protein 7B [Tenrec ecaudatus]|uniref:kelch domain-containing protein 7B n=1 Tax=Tenrec ecaudatus TaxID=94439 RepID=UPI003F5986C5
MALGASETDAPHWDWDLDGDEDWDSAVLTLLALAVVAATALALHWFGSGQDQEAADPVSSALQAQPPQVGAEPAPHPKAKMNDGPEEPGLEKSAPPAYSQDAPAVTEGAPVQESPGRGYPVASAGSVPQTPGKAVGTEGLRQLHSRGALEDSADPGSQPPGPGPAPLGRSKAGGMSRPILIHFTPRDPGGEVATVCPKEPAPQTPSHASEQDTSPWLLGAGPSRLQGRGRGSSQRRQGDRSSGDRPRSPRLDPLRLGAVVSVWDAVDAAVAAVAPVAPTSRPLAGSQSPHSPQRPASQELPEPHTVQVGPLADGLNKGQPVPVLALGLGPTAGGSKETPGDPDSVPEEGWPWASREVLITRSFHQAPGSGDPSSGGPRGDHPYSSPQQETPEDLNVAKAGAIAPQDAHTLQNLGLGKAERQEGHSLGAGQAGAGQAQGDQTRKQATGSQAVDLRPGKSLNAEKPVSALSRSAPDCTPSPSSSTHTPTDPDTDPNTKYNFSPSCNPKPNFSPSCNSKSQTWHNSSSSSSPNQNPSPDSNFNLNLNPSPRPNTNPSPYTCPDSNFNLNPSSRPNTNPSPYTCPDSNFNLKLNLNPSPRPNTNPSPYTCPGSNFNPNLNPIRTSAAQEPRTTLSKGSQERQISGGWETLMAMVLKNHPFPRQEGPQRSAPRASCPEERRGGPVGPGTEKPAEAPGVSQTGRAPASPGPGGAGTEETRLGSPPPRAAEPRPTPRPRKRSLCEVAQSSGSSSAGPARQELRQGRAQRQQARAAGGGLSAQQLEARRLLVFLQRPGGWGVAEGPRKASALGAELPATVAALRRRLNLGSCLEVLAFAQQHGARGLAQDTYGVMSDNLLHVLADPQLYRQLGAADRERILSLRTGRGQAVLGVLVLPGLYQVGRPGPAGAQRWEQGPAATAPPRAPLHVFNPRENSWRPLTHVPAEVPLRGCGLCTMYNYLFLAGGVRGSGAQAVCSNEVFCYNPLTDIWSQVRPMRQARAQLKLVALDGLLYAIGGECLYSMERYDPRTDSWVARAPLPAGTFPVAHEAVACRGDIYVTGGHLFYRLLRYSPTKDSWDECPYSASHRRSSDMVALGGFLYRFDLLRGVGAAVMRYNTVTGSWSRAASLPLPEPVPLRCAALGSTIYCLNHQVTATFTVSDATAQFEAQEMQPCPTGSRGILCPFVLTLPTTSDPLQTAI